MVLTASSEGQVYIWESATGKRLPDTYQVTYVFPFGITICSVYRYTRIVLEVLVRASRREPPSFELKLLQLEGGHKI